MYLFRFFSPNTFAYRIKLEIRLILQSCNKAKITWKLFMVSCRHEKKNIPTIDCHNNM